MITDPSGRPVSSAPGGGNAVGVTVEQAAAVYGQLAHAQTQHILGARVPPDIVLWQIAGLAAATLGAIPDADARSRAFAGFFRTVGQMAAALPRGTSDAPHQVKGEAVPDEAMS